MVVKHKKIENIYNKALKRIQKENASIHKIPEIYGIDNEGYFELVWDYPGKYYHQTLNIESDEEFIQYIVKETIRNHHGKYPAI